MLLFVLASPRDEYLDVQTTVSVDILRRVYDTFQKNGEAAEGEDDFLDPEAHLNFIDAFEMPLWNWSTEKGTFERYGLQSHAQIACLITSEKVCRFFDHVRHRRVSNTSGAK